MIELVNVCKRYGASEVLKGLNLRVNEGEFITVRGKSGTGKTTLLKIMGILESPDVGEVKLFSKSINGLNDNEKSDIRLHQIGFVFQFFNLIPSLTILENVELPLALARVNKEERKERAHKLLRHFRLDSLAGRFSDTLSGGERQRVALVRALANKPKIILADEPTSSIDDENSEVLMNLLVDTNRKRRVTIVLTTTDLYAEIPSSKDYLLKDGRLQDAI